MIYCISDIHGCYDEFLQLLEKINFTPEDMIYFLGDAIDRGKEPIKCLLYVMETPNIHMLMGNHELMMIDALLNPDDMDAVYHWMRNGGECTLRQFLELGEEDRVKVMEYIEKLPLLENVKVGEQNYVLVHAGLNVAGLSKANCVSTETVLPKQNPDDLLWIREKFFRKKALPKSITIFGHTNVSYIKGYTSNKVWRDEDYKDKIGIDGG